jgi:thiol:disulfide interchange protein
MAASSPNSAPDATHFAQSPIARARNLLIVLVAIALSTAVFWGIRTETKTASLSALAESAMPLEIALKSNKPTLMEFYANWCTSCQAMAGDVSTLKSQYEERVNFVMLNVDNTKWLPEMLHYRVDGIPHFIFLNAQGDAIASTIGEQPRSIMADNLEALISDQPLPHAKAIGQTSKVESSLSSKARAASKARADDPRGHGNQVVAQ